MRIASNTNRFVIPRSRDTGPAVGRVTLKQIANAVGVSPTTVCHALSRRSPRYVKPETRRLIQQAAQDLGYHRHHAARSLVTGRTHSLGVGLHSIDYLGIFFFSRTICGVEEAASERGYSLQFVSTGARGRQGRPEYVERALAAAFDGLLVFDELVPVRELLALQRRGFPVVLVNRTTETEALPSVSLDCEAGAYEMTRYLVSSGHRRIQVFAQAPGFSSTLRLLRGYRRALGEAGIPYDEAMITFFRPDGSLRQSADELFPAFRARGPDRPTALISEDLHVAAALQGQLLEAGMRIPQEVALVGFHDHDFNRLWLRPSISVIDTPLQEIGRRAAEMLFTLIEGGSLDQPQVLVRGEFVRRDTC